MKLPWEREGVSREIFVDEEVKWNDEPKVKLRK